MQFLRTLAQAVMPRAEAADQTLISDDKLDALVNEAKRERGEGDDRRPIFDFGPERAPTQPVQRVVETPPQTWINPAYDRGIAPSRPFGRRT